MKRVLIAAAFLATAAAAFAQEEYNRVDPSDAQYKQCLVRVNKLYDGGEEKSPIAGQNKAQAYCTCLWNETPEDFKGNLSKLADSDAGKKLDKMCVKYSKWE